MVQIQSRNNGLVFLSMLGQQIDLLLWNFEVLRHKRHATSSERVERYLWHFLHQECCNLRRWDWLLQNFDEVLYAFDTIRLPVRSDFKKFCMY